MNETEGQRFRRWVREIDGEMVASWRRKNIVRAVVAAPFIAGSLLFSCGLMLFSWAVME